jgi:hypothetical protein
VAGVAGAVRVTHQVGNEQLVPMFIDLMWVRRIATGGRDRGRAPKVQCVSECGCDDHARAVVLSSTVLAIKH